MSYVKAVRDLLRAYEDMPRATSPGYRRHQAKIKELKARGEHERKVSKWRACYIRNHSD